jgi:LPXTG-site transpeptidase (sortase) family protein
VAEQQHDGESTTAERSTRTVDLPPPPAGGNRRRRAWQGVAATVSVVGELLITAGVVMALFVAYSLWWTNVVANREAHHKADQVRQRWASGTDDGDGGKTPDGPGKLDTQGGLGFLHVPAMSDEPDLVMKGTSTEILNEGVAGYYTKPVKAALPSATSGNFALAAHRDGHGAKFHNIDRIHKGDPIVFETKDTWYVYEVYDILPQTSKFDVSVIDPVPKESGKTKKGRYITLTTCTPVYTSRYRYVVWGELERTVPVDADRTLPKELR